MLKMKRSDDHSAFGILVGFSCDKRNVILFDNSLLEGGSELRVDGMNNVAVRSVGVLARGHNNKELVSRIDDLDVVNRKAIVKGYRGNSLHRTFIKKFSDLDIGDLHNRLSFQK